MSDLPSASELILVTAPIRPAAAIANGIALRIAEDIAAQPAQVRSAVQLLDEGATAPRRAPKQSPGFMNRLEDRWRKRRDDGPQ